MTWGAVAGAAIGVVGSAMTNRGGGSSGGGAGSSTTDKSPWLQAQPWIINNMNQGQALQNRYMAQPFSDLQNQAYQNQANQSSYMRSLVPSLLGQISGQQVGFDRSNQNARPTAFNFDGVGSGGSGSGGLLSTLQSAPSSALNLNASAPAPAPEPPKSSFVNLDVTNPMNAYYGQLLAQNGVGADATNSQGTAGLLQAFQQSAGGAGYGSFKYGQAMPTPGTQAYRDMQEYLSYGGADPYNLYGTRAPQQGYTPAGGM